MIKFFGKNNDLRTEEGVITKTGYVVMLLSSVFGLCVFLTGRYLYGKSLKGKRLEYFLLPLHPLCRVHLPTNSYDAFNVLVIVD